MKTWLSPNQCRLPLDSDRILASDRIHCSRTLILLRFRMTLDKVSRPEKESGLTQVDSLVTPETGKYLIVITVVQ